ncbi:WYL domain-containing protein [Streptomyces sp. NPDC007346]|uniref:helix-turn-helix transcriptional regulator n=1 Tax=Streptomyces sp. NPDC007346 TaxID=3154682 RepID=UPI003453A0D2
MDWAASREVRGGSSEVRGGSGRYGGIAVLHGFRTDVTGLTTDEARALFVLATEGAHAALGLDAALSSALRKVMAALPAPHRPAAEQTSRLFRADRIRAADRTEEPARRRAGVELGEVWDVLRAQVERRPGGVRLRVRVHRSRLDLFRRLHAGVLTGEPQPDEPRAGERPARWLLAELAVPEVAWARSLLSFGPNLEVLAPPEARELLAEAAAQVVEVYAAGG